MPEFIIAYRGGNPPETPEAGRAHRKEWQTWLDGLGDAVVDPGTPLGTGKIVDSSGVSDAGWQTRLTGFTTIRAADLDGALEVAKECPFLDIGGSLEVAEVRSMK